MSDAAGIAVVGAGIVGACIAYALRKRGHAVTLIDRDAPGQGCSFGNSGAVSPGSVVPLALPGTLSSVPGMLGHPESPLYLPWRYLPRALPWLLRFSASARPARVQASVARLSELHAKAVARHRALTREVGVPELLLSRGHLHLYPDAAALAKDALGWRLREEHGYRPQRLDRAGIVALEPNAPAGYGVGMFLDDHATIVNPWRYVQAIASAFTSAGGVLQRTEVTRIAPSDRGWEVHQAGGPAQRHATLVVAAGAWSRRLLDPVGVHLHLESQRGYHVQFRGRAPVTRTVVLADRKVFCTPMEQGLRVGGTVEIGGLDAPPDPRRSAVLSRIATQAFPDLSLAGATHWMGHRPCMPDSVPVIGAAPGHPRLLLAVGHGHLGLTDAPHTGERIADLVDAMESG
jgi:D-amino-acid dehydrogenase